jgi:hypothetical protein
MLRELTHPPEDVVAAIAARSPPAAAGGEHDVTPGLEELLGELAPGLTGPHDEHATGRQTLRTPVLVRVHLGDPPRESGGHVGDPRSLERAGRDDDLIGGDRAV